MERFLKAQVFDVEPLTANSGKHWNHWLKAFNNFLNALVDKENLDKLGLLINHISTPVYEYISEYSSYQEVLKGLKEIYEKPACEVFSRYKLLSCIQKEGESLDQLINTLKQLSKECNFKSVDAIKNRDDYIRDAFIAGISSNFIRQWLLENKNLNLELAYDQARSLELAQIQAESYCHTHIPLNDSTNKVESSKAEAVSSVRNMQEAGVPLTDKWGKDNLSSTDLKNCFYCGGKMHHARSQCPAREAICHFCNIKGHFSKVCRRKNKTTLAAVSPLDNTAIDLKLNNVYLKALVDTGSSENFIDSKMVHNNIWRCSHSDMQVVMANTSKVTKAEGVHFANIRIKERVYENVKFILLPNLYTDVILGY